MLKALVLTTLLLLILPWLGLLDRSAGELLKYTEFPPAQIYVRHAGYDLKVFAGLTAGLLALILLCLKRIWIVRDVAGVGRVHAEGRFPLWGYGALLFTALAWIAAWTRFPAMGALQHHTFIPLWAGFILCANAFCIKRDGYGPMLAAPGRFLLLFPVSAVFWWVFEYLNRFTQNWSYLEVEHYTELQYFMLATFSFASVLPAVLSARALVGKSAVIEAAFTDCLRVPARRSFYLKAAVICAAGFALIGRYPNELFPLLWVVPPVLLAAFQVLLSRSQFAEDLAAGDWRRIVYWSLSGLLCGFFWEMWNILSLSKWIYHIPYVSGAYIFEMPLPGYAGYIPFGVLCGMLLETFYGPGYGGGKTGKDAKRSKTDNSPPFLVHAAIILDGNGRWAAAQGFARSFGHHSGIRVVRDIVEEALRKKIRYLTLYAFSSENWLRPRGEVRTLMNIFRRYLTGEVNWLIAHNIRLIVSGDVSRLPSSLQKAVAEAESLTADCRALTLVLAISYGGRGEITEAIRKIVFQVQSGTLQAGDISERLVRQNLYKPDIPDPDLIIRTGGEFRLSNFLLWQSAYSEIVVLDRLWPDFSPQDFTDCLEKFRCRERRYGALACTGQKAVPG